MNGYRKIIGSIFALVIWWYAVVNLWQSPDDMKIAAVAIVAIGVAMIGVGAVSLYKKVANRRWW